MQINWCAGTWVLQAHPEWTVEGLAWVDGFEEPFGWGATDKDPGAGASGMIGEDGEFNGSGLVDMDITTDLGAGHFDGTWNGYLTCNEVLDDPL